MYGFGTLFSVVVDELQTVFVADKDVLECNANATGRVIVLTHQYSQRNSIPTWEYTQDMKSNDRLSQKNIA